ncbi:MAG TPA: hypothetical protein VKA15_05460, partial [Isosphaeraceae bacterium]|nr:hypothetical protein [Isosphaeraceae bacterium]
EIVVWDAMTQAILGHWHEPETIPNRAMFTPDGRQVIVSGMRVAEARETLRAVRSLTLVYDAQTAANRRELVARDGAIGARIGLAVSPDGRTLATSGDASVLRFWDLEAGKLLREVESHSVEDLRYSPDGTRLAGANRSQVTIWNSATGEELLTLEIPGAEAGRAFNPVLAFSPDGKHLAARHSDGSILIWTGDASDQQAAAARHAAAERASGALFQLEHGLWLTRNGREDEAAAELKWAVDRQPSNAHYALTLKDFYINQQKWNDAVNLLERSLKRWSDRAWVPRSLGVVSALRGDFLKAMVWLARAAQIAPNDFSILTERLVAACGARDRAAVERLCDEALAAYETNHEPECRFQAAWHLVLTPPSSDSLRRAERLAAEIRPWHPAVVTKLELLQGTTAYRAGRYDAAVEILKRRPAQDVGRFVLAMAEHRLGQTKAARETFAKADAVLRQEFPESGPVKEADTRWCDWVVVNLVREEAKALLVGSEQIDNRK